MFVSRKGRHIRVTGANTRCDHQAINALGTLNTAQMDLSRSPCTITSGLHTDLLILLPLVPGTRLFLYSPVTETPATLPDTNNYPRGLSLFTKIYTPAHAPRLLTHLSNISTASDLKNFAISRIYGDILSDVSVLLEKDTGLLCFAACAAMAAAGEMTLVPQVKGHMYGARNLGASGEEVRGAWRIVEGVWKGVLGGKEFVGIGKELAHVVGKTEGW